VAENSIKQKDWRVIAYVRLSDEDSGKAEEEKSKSIENQIKYLELYVKNMKEQGEAISGHKVICDDGKTGTDTKRTGFREVIQLLECGEYNCLLITDLSRGFRNISDQTYYLEEYFPLHDIRFISTTLQYVDSYLLPQSAMNLGVKIQGITNEQFAYDTSIKIRSKFNSKRVMGEFIGAFAPYGYDKHENNSDLLVKDPEAAEVVRDIFKWYTKDLMSLSSIVKKLNVLDIPNPTKYKNQRGQNLKNPRGNDGLWSASSVRRVLTNEVYLGKMIQGKEEVINYKVHKSRRRPKGNWYVVEGTHEPIIDAQTFEAARRLLSLNVRAGEQGNIYPLGGLLKCGGCKKAMSRKKARGRAYYGCRTYREKGKQFCSSHSIPECILFDAVLEAVNYQFMQISNFSELQKRFENIPAVCENGARINSRIEISKKEIEDETGVFDKAYYDYAKGIISQEQFLRIREICEKRRAELENLIEELKAEAANAEKTKKSKSKYAAEIFKTGKARELTRALASDLIESVYVHEDKSLEINFRFADPFNIR
jgi:hypothetical protein